jgi:hypothetical protein
MSLTTTHSFDVDTDLLTDEDICTHLSLSMERFIVLLNDWTQVMPHGKAFPPPSLTIDGEPRWQASVYNNWLIYCIGAESEHQEVDAALTAKSNTPEADTDNLRTILTVSAICERYGLEPAELDTLISGIPISTPYPMYSFPRPGTVLGAYATPSNPNAEPYQAWTVTIIEQWENTFNSPAEMEQCLAAYRLTKEHK